ncbi:LysR family transcriptional regulator [Sulfitobacter sp. D35]|uniref:helix-turn-helix domain-containing protein n=1 Tax=Sulfitobacter sp. D35 TaxID=3083252 RepID=UPI00296FE70A|nr:LysR family transcriptional regulator [Sulfitobacter sp. D35]MDW4500527.1 LysR family transcriptional regulator [Sulfitobacter sp. D35]
MNQIVPEHKSAAKVTKAQDSHALLHEMIRSFTTLARTLNLSHAVKELGSTRQTVRRHITQLEEAKGTPLFIVEDRQYRLTDAGEKALPEALNILALGNSWLSGHLQNYQGLPLVQKTHSDGWSFWQQQRPIGELWTSSRPLLRESLRAWARAGGALEDSEMEHVRPYFVVFRDTPNGWICVELGDECSYVSWFGWSHARSSIGRVLEQLLAGDDFGRLVNMPYEEVHRSMGLRLDHIHTQMHREGTNALVPISYQRLLMGGRFPDGSFALLSVVDRCYDLRIEGLENTQIRSMPKDLVMEVDENVLKFGRKSKR